MSKAVTLPTLRAVFEAHHDELKRFVVRLVGCPELAAEIVHEVWLKVACYDPREPVNNARAYLYRVADNLATDWLRKDRKRARLAAGEARPEEIVSSDPVPEAILQGRQEIEILERALLELSDNCRAAFLLQKADGLSIKMIGAQLQLSPRTVEKHIARAMLHCRSRLREADRDV